MTADQALAPSVSFAHLAQMTDEFGTFEHADHSVARSSHGYCTDDMARLLVVACRETSPSKVSDDLANKAFRFVLEAQGPAGDTCNRRDRYGRWSGGHGVEDCWGRSLWGLGTAVARSAHQPVRELALAHFEVGARQRSPWPRAMAFAALGAAEVVVACPGHPAAQRLLADAVDVVLPAGGPQDVDHAAGSRRGRGWLWPEARLSYANAVLAEAVMAAGAALGRPEILDAGIALLDWLLDHETQAGHLSVTPSGGAGPGDPKPAFDQQPIEVAALADACDRAGRLTGSPRWDAGLALAVAWFLGDNDASCPMWDSTTGGGYDGLCPGGPNLNQGAESTIALVSTLQHARRLGGLVL